ncbi:peptidase S26B, signal peptidase [Halorubrum distributum JCM 13561]|uniref:Peptidase S26B, signal peptidase n=1 Tax=Halorubrum distributum JCM 13561 TaxID=1227483 RepID=M0NVX4_9EURY|nr:signal peptidase I [Halorubrum litoreum]EMA60730.1 peptidase S26B, signal peptidase [Halorubrum litoreum JCM 13561]
MTTILTSPRTKRAANVLGIVLLIALVAPFAAYAAPEVVGADESFVVLTASMTPAIAPGDVVIVADRDPAAIAEGDVITFMRGTSEVPVTHRVIDVVDEGGALAFETMGDANEGPDPGLVSAGSLVGAVTLTIPYIGYVIQFAGTRVGFVALVLLPFGLLAVTEVWSIVRGRDGAESPATATVNPDGEPVGGGDAETAAFEFAAESELAPTAAATAASGSGGISVDAVGGAAAVLAVFAPYAAYVAFELRSAAAIAVAVAAATLLFGALATWVPASGVLDRSVRSAASESEGDASETAADGGVSESDADSDESDAGSDESDADSDGTDSAAVATGEERVEPDESAPVRTPTARPDAAGEVD